RSSDLDQMIVNKFTYRIQEPERFDIIVFHASQQKDFIKRIIGLPGEHVEVKDHVLYIDGEAVEEPFLAKHKDQLHSYHTADFRLEDLPGGYEKIPEGLVHVLGDKRGNSRDSRAKRLIPMDQRVEKTNIIYWLIDRRQCLSEK